MKANWLHKHHRLLPSVVVLFFEACNEWVSGEWTKREASIVDTYNRMKQVVSGRECKIVLVLIRTGAEAETNLQEMEERFQRLLRRRLERRVQKSHCSMDSTKEARKGRSRTLRYRRLQK